MQHTFLMEFEKKLNFKYYTYLKINKLKKKKGEKEGKSPQSWTKVSFSWFETVGGARKDGVRDVLSAEIFAHADVVWVHFSFNHK